MGRRWCVRPEFPRWSGGAVKSEMPYIFDPDAWTNTPLRVTPLARQLREATIVRRKRSCNSLQTRFLGAFVSFPLTVERAS
jgi:hypothetical protein